uniref:Uncharacterized protein n=1 Tax=Davidia involucrata TaxID=16924 RepID=A0A5B6YXY5_DAVIN
MIRAAFGRRTAIQNANGRLTRCICHHTMELSKTDSPFRLLGPPEMHLCSVMDQSPGYTNSSMDLLVPKLNNAKLNSKQSATLTYPSTGNPCLDFFFHVVMKTPQEVLVTMLQLAWDHNPLTTLKLICYLRCARGFGKSNREGFYLAALWLQKNHPKTLACNIRTFVKFGHFKDLPEILYQLLEGPNARRNALKERRKLMRGNEEVSRIHPNLRARVKLDLKHERRMLVVKVMHTLPQEEIIAAEMLRINIVKEEARSLRKEKRIVMAKRAVEMYEYDPDYRSLHDLISDLFAKLLKSDIEYLHSGNVDKISLAAKWCPSLDSSFDRSILLCESIARRIFPRDSDPEYEGIEEAYYAYRVRDRLRKQILVPLRKALDLPEVYMSANQWNLLPYDRVASVAMKNYMKIFFRRDEERMSEFIQKVRLKKEKVAPTGSLLPPEISAIFKYNNCSEVSEFQWLKMIEEVLKKGKLKNCLVSINTKMKKKELEASIALGLLISELAEDPWKGKTITYNKFPRLLLIEGGDGQSKAEFLRNIESSLLIDFEYMFDAILEYAAQRNLSEDKMIKKIIMFTDNEFDCFTSHYSARMLTTGLWDDDYEYLCRKFQESGYTSIPEIVFWHLGRDATEILGWHKGVVTIRGFSKEALRMFLEAGESLSREFMMDFAISGEEYSKLVVHD